MAEQFVGVRIADARTLALKACAAAGAGPAVAASLARAVVSAMQNGRAELGLPHLAVYLRAFREGRIDGNAVPSIEQKLPAMICADAKGGIAQLGFDLAYDNLVRQAQDLGIAVFTQKNSYTTGELGYYVRRLAADGLIAIAATNGPALMAAASGGKPVYCTNPLAFAAPAAAPETPLVIDQASSATAFYNIARAARDNQAIPPGWAIDDEGAATTDPHKALQGALLPFGGYKGANIALMVEVLSAGLSNSSWSLEAGALQSQGQPTIAALTVIALSPAGIDPDFGERMAAQIARLRGLGVHIPGAKAGAAEPGGTVLVEASVLDEIRACAKL